MITLDQVQLLEKKVEAIVSKMNDLQRQNVALQEKNRDLIEKNSLLMQKISSFEADQNRIEQGILNALDRLNSMENSALKVGSSATSTQNVQEVVLSNTENNFTEATSQPNELTNFSNIQAEQVAQEQEVQQEYQENNYQPQEESLNFSEEKLDEEINSEETENNNSEGLNLNFDFDDNIQEEDNQQAQLGIF
ncbi:MAG: cell division protein ZapB [Treponemataceae bacterium]|nr:cell division protein ZapB [Treponemataceae bacterium]